jgi:hypothetical protein
LISKDLCNVNIAIPCVGHADAGLGPAGVKNILAMRTRTHPAADRESNEITVWAAHKEVFADALPAADAHTPCAVADVAAAAVYVLKKMLAGHFLRVAAGKGSQVVIPEQGAEPPVRTLAIDKVKDPDLVRVSDPRCTLGGRGRWKKRDDDERDRTNCESMHIKFRKRLCFGESVPKRQSKFSDIEPENSSEKLRCNSLQPISFGIGPIAERLHIGRAHGRVPVYPEI